jgi:Leucine-rich repeat (LRR) protein
VFILNGKEGRRNSLTMSLMFQRLHHLKQLTLTYNRIPRIGSKAFGDSRGLQLLDMRNNEIASLEVDEFLDLDNLRELYLGNNRLKELISGVFYHLKGLSHLDLSYNQLKELHSRVFLNLRNLSQLDLSGNPFGNITSKTFRDLISLKTLRLANCKLKQLHSLAIDGLPSLYELDLSSNLFERIRFQEFKATRSLRVLQLSSNKIAILEEKAFFGHQNLQLNLSNNRLVQLDPCAFCEASIESLDLSRNRLRKLKSKDFAPITDTLQSLNLSFNYDLNEYDLASTLSTLKALRTCNISNMALDDRFRFRTAFSASTKSLATIDLSFNHMYNLSGNSFPPLTQLRHLDLSKNRIEMLDANATAELARLSLQHLRLAANGMSCRNCDLFYFWAWLRTQPNAFSKNCEGDDTRDCLVCRTPNYMRGERVDLLTEQMLASCDYANDVGRPASAGSRIALVVGLFSISLVVILLVLVVIRKRYKGAIYYTNESNKKNKLNGKLTASEADVPIATISALSNHNLTMAEMDASRRDDQPFTGDNPLQSSRSSSHISKDIINDILYQVEHDWRYADDPPYNEFTADRLKELEDQRLNDELQMPSDSLTMPSSMTVLETYVRCTDMDTGNEAQFSSYELPEDFEQTSAKTYEISPNSFLV